MNNVAFFLGDPVSFKNICYVYPPKVREVATNKEYPIYLKLFTMSQEELEDEYVEKGIDLSELLTPFEYILNNAYNNNYFKSLLERAFYFFLHEKVTFLFE